MTYEPGYGAGQERINEAMRPVYEPYNRAVAKKMIKDTPALSGWIVKKETKEVEHKGKKMKRIRIQPVKVEVGSNVTTTIHRHLVRREHWETIIKLEGLADDLYEATAKRYKQLGITDAKVVKTSSHEGGDD